MNIKIFLLVFVVLIVGCRSFEFVYDKSPTIKLLENNTQVIVGGEDTYIIKSYISNVVGKSTSSGKFKLLVSSSQSSNKTVIRDNQTVSQIEIKHILSYNLQSGDGGCIISEAEISSSSTYNLKSSGYSFGTDLAKKETVNNNIEKNINEFFHLLTQNYSNLDCKNEN
ncbi:hypothetical protein OAJ74_02850 [Alphaproteobacteria bacterium]|nr:hypothetical protein [Alphaproteobacteria bacterium]